MMWRTDAAGARAGSKPTAMCIRPENKQAARKRRHIHCVRHPAPPPLLETPTDPPHSQPNTNQQYAGVTQLIEFGVARELYRIHVRDFLVWLVAFIITTFAGVEIGLLASIVLSLLILILETAFPHTALLGRVGKTAVYRCVCVCTCVHVLCV